MIRRNLDGEFDTALEFSDWRYSASAVGLMRYFDEEGIDYTTNYEEEYLIDGERKIKVRNDLLCYNTKDILLDNEENKKKYMDFVEKYFRGKMHHLRLKAIIKEDSLNEDDIKSIKETMKANVIMKKVFKGINIDLNSDEASKVEILDLLEKNRYDLIEETYKNGMATYRNFCNQNSLGATEANVCRLVGYYVDLPKKKKSVAYNWDYSTYVYEDCPEFDYIPFGFSKTRDAFFINNNFSAEELLKANDNLNNSLHYENDIKDDSKNARHALFLSSSKAAEFINYQVEIVIKNRDKDYFETMFVRDSAIDVFKNISDSEDEFIVKALSKPCRYSRDSYLNITDIVVNSILNMVRLDQLIDKLLKDKKENNHKFLISQLIRINTDLYEKIDGVRPLKESDKNNNIKKGVIKDMNKDNYFAKKAADEVTSKIEKNKVISYRNKLISCLTFKDYDRFCTVLLQLSAYSTVSFDFAYNLFEDFEKNKNVAYTFVNALKKSEVVKEGKKE